MMTAPRQGGARLDALRHRDLLVRGRQHLQRLLEQALHLLHFRGRFAGLDVLAGGLRASIGLARVFDRDYRRRGSGTNGFGRTLVVAMEAHW